jgi:hypothetical protein
MARITGNRSELQPAALDKNQVIGYLIFFGALGYVLLVLMFFSYTSLANSVSEACAATGAAAKLDLSSFVPICKGMPR